MDRSLFEFREYCKRVEPSLKVFKKHLKNFLRAKKNNTTNNLNFLQEVQRYEGLNLKTYTLENPR